MILNVFADETGNDVWNASFEYVWYSSIAECAVITYDGLNLLINWGLKYDDAPNLVLKLYSNNYVPDKGSDSTDFVEATFSGYSQHTLIRNQWDDATTNGDEKGESVYGDIQSYTFGTSQTIYGCYVDTDDTNETVIYARRFESPKNGASNDKLHLIMKMIGYSEN